MTFSTDIAPMVRTGLVPAFVDVTPDTFQIDVDAIEEMIGPRTRAILAPNLIGNAPDWDRIRGDRRPPRAEGRRGLLRRPRLSPCAGRRPAPGPTSASPASPCPTSSPRPAPAGWSASTTTNSPTRPLLRRWGRRSEVQLFGSRKGVDRRFFSTIDGDIEYDNLFIFDELGWNFEPSELSAAFGLVQLDKLVGEPGAPAAKLRPDRRPLFSLAPTVHPARLPTGSRPVGTCSPSSSTPTSGSAVPIPAVDGTPRRRHPHGVDRKRRPSARLRDQPHRHPGGGLPNADRVMDWGIVLPNAHSMTDDDCDYIGDCLGRFVTERGLA